MTNPTLTPQPREGGLSVAAILLLGIGTMALFAGLAVIEAAAAWGVALVVVAAGAIAAAGVIGFRRARPL